MAGVFTILILGPSLAVAQAPGAPVYSHTFADAVTGDPAASRATTATSPSDMNFSAFGNGGRFVTSSGAVSYDIDQFQPGSTTQRADSYRHELFERPTDQTFKNYVDSAGNVRFGLDTGGVKYYSYLDIEGVRAGFDSRFLYVSMDLYGRNSFNTGSGASNGENKLQGFYGFRIGEHPGDPESRGGYFVRFEKATENAGTSFALNSTASIFKDTPPLNVGGSSIDGTLASTLEGGDTTGLGGYDMQVVADGKTNGNGSFASGLAAVYTRIDPTDNTRVEFALDYGLFGFTAAELAGPDLFLLFQASEGLNDAANPFWNDKYTYGESGTPNPDERGVCGPSSCFQTTGLQNIYRVDTLLGGSLAPIPEPQTYAMLLAGLLVLGWGAIRRKGSG